MLHLLPIGLWLLCIHLSKGTKNPYGERGGGGGQPSPPPQPTVEETASDVAQSKLQYDAPIAENYYNILTNPDYGLGPTNQAYEDVRNQQYPEETKVRQALVQNALKQLLSPTGITEEQQESTEAIRDRELQRMMTDVRTASNLGGKLFGGQRIDKEAETSRYARQGFAKEDVNRDERNQLNTQSLALSIMQALYPGSQITQPQWQSPVPGGDTAFAGANQAYGTQVNAQAQQYAANQAMWGSLFQGIGNAIPG